MVDYTAETGQGSLGVEFAVTAVTSDGYGELNNTHSNSQSRDLIRDNPALHWAEGYYRGYLELSVQADRVNALFLGT
jgi:alkaline phosphatase D